MAQFGLLKLSWKWLKNIVMVKILWEKNIILIKKKEVEQTRYKISQTGPCDQLEIVHRINAWLAQSPAWLQLKSPAINNWINPYIKELFYGSCVMHTLFA